jgi:hypothetical protein
LFLEAHFQKQHMHAEVVDVKILCLGILNVMKKLGISVSMYIVCVNSPIGIVNYM